MICEQCGVEMNHHADKVDYNAGLDDPNEIDPVYGGVLEEAHTCPRCGRTEVRAAVNGGA
jgi:ribosomal protein S27AE